MTEKKDNHNLNVELALLKSLDIDVNLIPKYYDEWNGCLWSFANDLESYDYALSYAWENFDPETGKGKTEYEEAVKEYDSNIEELRKRVIENLQIGHISEYDEKIEELK